MEQRHNVGILELLHIIFCFWWFSFLVADLHLVVICLFVCSRWLVVAGCYYYYCLSDNQQSLCTKVEEAGGLPLGKCTGGDRQLFQA